MEQPGISAKDVGAASGFCGHFPLVSSRQKRLSTIECGSSFQAAYTHARVQERATTGQRVGLPVVTCQGCCFELRVRNQNKKTLLSFNYNPQNGTLNLISFA